MSARKKFRMRTSVPVIIDAPPSSPVLDDQGEGLAYLRSVLGDEPLGKNHCLPKRLAKGLRDGRRPSPASHQRRRRRQAVREVLPEHFVFSRRDRSRVRACLASCTEDTYDPEGIFTNVVLIEGNPDDEEDEDDHHRGGKEQSRGGLTHLGDWASSSDDVEEDDDVATNISSCSAASSDAMLGGGTTFWRNDVDDDDEDEIHVLEIEVHDLTSSSSRPSRTARLGSRRTDCQKQGYQTHKDKRCLARGGGGNPLRSSGGLQEDQPRRRRRRAKKNALHSSCCLAVASPCLNPAPPPRLGPMFIPLPMSIPQQLLCETEELLADLQIPL